MTNISKESKLVRVRRDVAKGVAIYNVRQKRCWVLVSADLQKYVDKDIDWTDVDTVRKVIPLNQDGNYCVEIPPHCIVSKGHSYAGVLETIRKMTEIWIPIEYEDGGFRKFVIFNDYYVSPNGKFYVYLNRRALEFLITLKKGYFSTFHTPSFLKLTSSSSMDLFLYLSENYNRNNKNWIVTIEEFKKRIGCNETYDFDKIKTKILEPAIKEYKKQNTLLTFTYIPEYSRESLTSPRRGRRKIDCIAFEIIMNTEL